MSESTPVDIEFYLQDTTAGIERTDSVTGDEIPQTQVVFPKLPEGLVAVSTTEGTYIYDQNGRSVYDPNLA